MRSDHELSVFSDEFTPPTSPPPERVGDRRRRPYIRGYSSASSLVSDSDHERPRGFSDEELTDAEMRRMSLHSGFYAPPRDIEEKHHQLNSLFGIRPFQASVLDRPYEDHSAAVQSLYDEPNEIEERTYLEKKSQQNWCNISSIDRYVWVLICGWWLCAIYAIVGALLLCTVIGKSYATVCFKFSRYYLYPFSKVVATVTNYDDERQFITKKTGDQYQVDHKIQRKCSPGHFVWCLFSWTILLTANIIAYFICWFLVIFIPMSKILRQGVVSVLFAPNPLDIEIYDGYPSTHADVIMCTFQAVNKNYYKYTVFGVNIVLLNLLPVVLIALFFSYVPFLLPWLKPPDMFMFILSMISAIPLAYYIGLALSSLSAQTSFSVGAVLNATFGSIIELILYFSALSNGLSDVVQASVTGSLLALMLLLPGLSMLFGGLKYKDMKFNPASAGVSGVLLLLSVVGAFLPTIYYQLYGHYVLDCNNCFFTNTTQVCNQCLWRDVADLDNDPIYMNSARHLMYFCAAILPLSYIVGLIFTLKTHAHIVDDPEYIDAQAALEHIPAGPKWSKVKCILVLSVCTLMFGLLAEEIVRTLEPSLEVFGISNAFAGLTIIAVVSYTVEFVNAIQFAIHNNFSMSLEIANQAAVQVSLIQVPMLVAFSAILGSGDATNSFTLIFPTLDVFTVLLSVIIMNYISIDGKANYFLGFSLLIVYALMVSVYFYLPSESGGVHGHG